MTTELLLPPSGATPAAAGHPPPRIRLVRRLGALCLLGLLMGVTACAGSGRDGQSTQAHPEATGMQRYATAPAWSERTPAPVRSSRSAAPAWSHLEPTAMRMRPAAPAWPPLDPSSVQIQSASALLMDQHGRKLYAKNIKEVRPIASVTKLMTAMVVLDSGVSLRTPVGIVESDRDRLRNSRSRLRIGEAKLPREQMMRVMLMSSDNRAAHALARTTLRGGTPAFVRAMNRKARSLGMRNTNFADSSGLDARNRSTAEDLVKMVRAAGGYPFIRDATSRSEMTVYPFADGSPLHYRNTNPLVHGDEWTIEISKTGFINEAGRCLVMQTRIDGQPLYIVLLGANGKLTPAGDSNRLRDWLLAAAHRSP